ncbi:MAG TPA: pyridoxal phosphate-dependent aminotransferase [Solirubrobacteraceae bacterium]|nr:pyridoxal phosphate-dependent aminotransferase [Solirubrobacteraceae bacterium]
MSSVLTWTEERQQPRIASERLRRLRASHHAMWNYLTYRDAITVLGLDAADIYPAGATRLDPRQWADLGWLTCFCGPPASAVRAMRDAVSAEALNQYTPDLIEPLRDAAAAQFGCARGDAFEVVGAEGAQAALALALMACVDPGDEVIVSDPGYFHIPSAIIAAGGVPVSVAIHADNGFRLDPDAVSHVVSPRTRAICIVDPVNPYGTIQTHDELQALADLAERHDLLLVHDVTHAPLALDSDTAFSTLPALGATDRSVAVMSVSHCYGMAGARIGFLGGAPGFVRGCLQLKAALTRLNTNLIAQHGALAALADGDYLAAAARTITENLAHLEQTLTSVPGARLVVRPQRGLACAVDVSGTGASAQELMIALFARRVAVYPADGLGETGAATTIRLNLSRPDPWAMEHLREVLPDAVAESASGRWRGAVVSLLERKGTARADALARRIRSLA